ncbi:MAG: hypothetical protein ACREMM_01310 [Gemmatimonadales bacterium]
MTAPANDLLSSRGTTNLVYGVPSLAIAATGVLRAGEAVLALVWTLGFTVMGVACVVNAMRCGRMHCYFMGPFLLLVAAATLLHGLGVVSLGPSGWQWLGLVAIAGTVVLLVVPERLWGRYTDRANRASS